MVSGLVVGRGGFSTSASGRGSLAPTRMGEMELVGLGAPSPPEASSRPEPDEDAVRQQQPGASCSNPAGASEDLSSIIIKVASFGALGGFLFGCAQGPLLLSFGLRTSVELSRAPPRRYDLALIGGALLLLKDELHLSGAGQPSRAICHQKRRPLKLSGCAQSGSRRPSWASQRLGPCLGPHWVVR